MSKDYEAAWLPLRRPDDLLLVHAGNGLVNDHTVDCFRYRQV